MSTRSENKKRAAPSLAAGGRGTLAEICRDGTRYPICYGGTRRGIKRAKMGRGGPEVGSAAEGAGGRAVEGGETCSTDSPTNPGPVRFACVVAYDGTSFHGWQTQGTREPNTVQGHIERRQATC